jgi:hypothetical protein
MSDALDNLIDHIAGEIAQRAENRLRGVLEKLARENTQFVYSEEEAAKFLADVSVETLQSWRRRGLISYSNFPRARVREGQEDDDLGSTYAYSLESLLEFQQKYQIPATGAKKKGTVLELRKSA